MNLLLRLIVQQNWEINYVFTIITFAKGGGGGGGYVFRCNHLSVCLFLITPILTRCISMNFAMWIKPDQRKK